MEHYLLLPLDELLSDVLRHYRENVWPKAKAIVMHHAMDPAADRLILEGSALLPELVAGLRVHGVAALWLTADDALFERRIYAESRYATRSPSGTSICAGWLFHSSSVASCASFAPRIKSLS